MRITPHTVITRDDQTMKQITCPIRQRQFTSLRLDIGISMAKTEYYPSGKSSQF